MLRLDLLRVVCYSGLSTVAGGCFNLINLLLRGCSSITDTGIGRVVKACSKLKVGSHAPLARERSNLLLPM